MRQNYDTGSCFFVCVLFLFPQAHGAQRLLVIQAARRPGANINDGNIYTGKPCILTGIYQRQHIQYCHISRTRQVAVITSDERTHDTGEFLGARRTTKGLATPLFFLGRLYKGGYTRRPASLAYLFDIHGIARVSRPCMIGYPAGSCCPPCCGLFSCCSPC